MKAFEVHEHHFVRGTRTRGGYRKDGSWETGKIVHSHPGGDVPHQHPETGPACYTIDKDEWTRLTGLKGGGPKKFTSKPSGEQFPVMTLEDWQKSFDVVICKPTPKESGEGGALAATANMALRFRMTFEVKDGPA